MSIAGFLLRALKVCQCCIRTYAGRIDFRESGRADSPGSCITRGRQVARFRPTETIVPTGAHLCVRRAPPCYTARSYMGQNGTEWYGMRQKQNTPIVSARTHIHTRPSAILVYNTSVLRLLQICKRLNRAFSSWTFKYIRIRGSRRISGYREGCWRNVRKVGVDCVKYSRDRIGFARKLQMGTYCQFLVIVYHCYSEFHRK